MEIEMVVTSYSRMLGGSCVAGISFPDLKWIRPSVHGRDRLKAKIFGSFQDVSLSRIAVSDGSELRVLDLVRLDIERLDESRFQPENRRSKSYPWHLISRPAPIEYLQNVVEKKSRWTDILHSSEAFLTHETAERSSCDTLELLKPSNIIWASTVTWQEKPQVRASFDHLGARCDLPITDWVVEQFFLKKEPGVYPDNRANVLGSIGDFYGIAFEPEIYFNASLGQPRENGRCYKVLAGIIPLPKQREKHAEVEKVLNDDVDPILELLINDGISFVDKRPVGRLWIVGGNDLAERVSRYNDLGFAFVYSENGGKATQRRPSWYLRD